MEIILWNHFMESYALNKQFLHRGMLKTLHWKSNYIQLCNYVMEVSILSYFFQSIGSSLWKLACQTLKTAERKYRKHYINNKFLSCLTFLGTRRNDQVVLNLICCTFTRLENVNRFFVCFLVWEYESA